MAVTEVFANVFVTSLSVMIIIQDLYMFLFFPPTRITVISFLHSEYSDNNETFYDREVTSLRILFHVFKMRFKIGSHVEISRRYPYTYS